MIAVCEKCCIAEVTYPGDWCSECNLQRSVRLLTGERDRLRDECGRLMKILEECARDLGQEIWVQIPNSIRKVVCERDEARSLFALAEQRLQEVVFERSLVRQGLGRDDYDVIKHERDVARSEMVRLRRIEDKARIVCKLAYGAAPETQLWEAHNELGAALKGDGRG